MNIGETRPLSDHEFAATVARATARLHGTVQRLDDGDDLALDDLANVLRLMICVGDGNRLLQRGLERARAEGSRHRKIALPAVTSQAGNHWGMLPFLSGGNLPADDGDPPSSLQRFVATTCLRAIDDDTEAVFDWNGLVRVVAEKLGGVHADDETPVLIDELKTYQIAEIPLIHYMLRACALVVVQAGAGVAEFLGAPVSLETLPLTPPPGRWIGGFAIAGDVEGNLDVRVQIRGGDPPGTLVGRGQVPIPKPLMDPAASGPGATIRRRVEPVGRNDPCPCGSGRKYKRCHGGRI